MDAAHGGARRTQPKNKFPTGKMRCECSCPPGVRVRAPGRWSRRSFWRARPLDATLVPEHPRAVAFELAPEEKADVTEERVEKSGVNPAPGANVENTDRALRGPFCERRCVEQTASLPQCVRRVPDDHQRLAEPLRKSQPNLGRAKRGRAVQKSRRSFREACGRLWHAFAKLPGSF